MNITHVAMLEIEVRDYLVKVYDTVNPYVKVEFIDLEGKVVSVKYFGKGEYLEAKIKFEVELLTLKGKVKGA